MPEKGSLVGAPAAFGEETMRACQCRNPIFCILPPFILRSVVENGT
jgi:hypothetical protein